MTDEEYREFLSALARRHLRPIGLHRFGPEGAAHLAYEIERLASVARFVRTVSERERSENSALLKELAQELGNVYLGGVIEAMEQTGVLSALDEAPETTFANLRRSAIPDEDAHFLRQAAVDDPEAEITILIQYSRTRFGRDYRDQSSPSEIARQAQTELKSAAERIERMVSRLEGPERSEPKKRKLFNGIGKILAGTVTGAGNMLLAAGTILAPNPATAWGVIGSSALAIGGICQGIGDLRGE